MPLCSLGEADLIPHTDEVYWASLFFLRSVAIWLPNREHTLRFSNLVSHP